MDLGSARERVELSTAFRSRASQIRQAGASRAIRSDRAIWTTLTRHCAQDRRTRCKDSWLRHGLRNEGIGLSVEPTAVDVLVKAGFEPQYGARPIRRAIEEQIVFPIAKELERAYPKKVTAIRVDALKARFNFMQRMLKVGKSSRTIRSSSA